MNGKFLSYRVFISGELIPVLLISVQFYSSLSSMKSENKHRTLVLLELQVILIISNHWVSSCKWNVFIVWGRNAGEINGGEGLDFKGVRVVIHYRKIHGADSKVGGPKWHLCVNHGNF